MSAKDAINYIANGGEIIGIGLNVQKSDSASSVAVGKYALLSETGISDKYNTAVGYNASPSITNATNCTSVGALANQAVVSSTDNTAIGYQCMPLLDTTTLFRGQNNENTAVGSKVLTVLDGNLSYKCVGNTAIGFQAGAFLENGSYNTLLGCQAQVSTGNMYTGQVAFSPYTYSFYVPNCFDYNITTPNTLTINGAIKTSSPNPYLAAKIATTVAPTTPTALNITVQKSVGINSTPTTIVLPTGYVFKVDYSANISSNGSSDTFMYFTTTGSLAPFDVTPTMSIETSVASASSTYCQSSAIVDTTTGSSQTLTFYVFNSAYAATFLAYVNIYIM